MNRATNIIMETPTSNTYLQSIANFLNCIKDICGLQISVCNRFMYATSYRQVFIFTTPSLYAVVCIPPIGCCLHLLISYWLLFASTGFLLAVVSFTNLLLAVYQLQRPIQTQVLSLTAPGKDLILMVVPAAENYT